MGQNSRHERVSYRVARVDLTLPRYVRLAGGGSEHNSYSFPLLLRELSLKRVSSLRGRVAGATVPEPHTLCYDIKYNLHTLVAIHRMNKHTLGHGIKYVRSPT